MKTTIENFKAAYTAVGSLGAVAENPNITHVVAVRLREQSDAAGFALDAIKAEHAALVAVAEAALELVEACSKLKFMEHKDSSYSQWSAAKDTLSALAAVRAGNGGAK
jgi:hypothetical protein